MTKVKKKATIKDVAIKAGTSITTVSRVLSGSDYPVSGELRAEIMKATKELNYKPNVFGQLLRGAKNRQIGVVVPSITTPFYSQLISAVQKECMDKDYVLMLYTSQNNTRVERDCIEALIQSQVAGALLSLIHWDEDIGNQLNEAGIEYVLFDQPHEDYDGASIDFDFCAAGEIAANYFIDNGYHEIAFASGELDRPSRKKLLEGFKSAMAERALPLDNDFIIINTTIEKTGASAVKDYQCGSEIGKRILNMEYLPEAIFAINDMMAMGIIKQLEKNGIYVPADISIMGFDNVEFGEMITPALTTISQSAYQMGELAMDLLTRNLTGNHKQRKSILLNPVLIERDSVRIKHKKIRRKRYDEISV